MIKNIILIVVFYFSLISLSCVSSQAPAPLAEEPEDRAKSMDNTVPQEAWERDWRETLAVAKREGKLSIYSTAGSEVRRVISQAFKDKFGMDIEWTAGRSGETSAKLFRERGAGIYLADLTTGGSGDLLLTLKPAGVLEPIKTLLVLPEVLDEKVWYGYGGKLPFLDKEQSYVISSILYPGGGMIINTAMVKPEEISSYNNLLESRWKGKIVLNDPTMIGAPVLNTWIVLYIQMGPDFWRKFAANSPVLMRDDRLATEWGAQGKYPIIMGTKKDTAVEFIKAGAPLKIVKPPEGNYLVSGDAVAFINRAPHPNAAKVFINWYLSKEGSYILSRSTNNQSARRDVPIEHLSPEDLRNPVVQYIMISTEEFNLQKPAFIERAKEIFGPLLK